ncbi:hypothetical protein HGRIS_000221 [Hohenbuehelia grisea]|uniref:Histone deacetylase interacting domain-containing protein n=1 Tax=Hohenbuehelia grisea TaxID=104357 RepID=A0ABR3JS89_9AGAR
MEEGEIAADSPPAQTPPHSDSPSRPAEQSLPILKLSPVADNGSKTAPPPAADSEREPAAPPSGLEDHDMIDASSTTVAADTESAVTDKPGEPNAKPVWNVEPTRPESRNALAQSQDATDSARDVDALTDQPTQPQVSPPPPQNAPGTATPAAERPLNVTDALSYLDAVKVQFNDQPNVYNRFLDIMKDFKSQLIDTPGVIKRVSTLFNGHPSLIQGFNTFLPAGYRIECSSGPMGADGTMGDNFITVTTPTGTTVHTMAAMQDLDQPPPPLPPPVEPPMLKAEHNLHMYEGADGLTYEPAVQYVQKIKKRCDEETYKAFLAILTSYYNYPGSVDEQDVSLQIAKLFKDAPDLHSDFRSFMPEKGNALGDPDGGFGALAAGLAGALMGHGDPRESKSNKRKSDALGGPGLSGAVSGSVPAKRKRKAGERERERERDRAGDKDRDRGADRGREKDRERSSKKLKHTSSHDLSSSAGYNPSKLSGRASPAPARRSTHAAQPIGHGLHAHQQSQHPHMQPQHHQQQQQSTRGPGVAGAPPRPGASQHQNQQSFFSFFDRVKRALDSKDTYAEFLKVVNLFTQEYIDTARFVQKARMFLGEGELMMELREIVGWDERRERESWERARKEKEAGGEEGGWTRPVVIEKPIPGRVDLNVKYGSYRRLPASEINVTCSGRDEMCRAVLNDEWVSHPTWASEDAGFVASKKNIYEEALHRSEEERHEYDFHIEGIGRLITLLEPWNHKIAQLPPEERSAFKIKPNLGGTAKSIHHRILKKIYGREAGVEVIQAIQDTPSVAVPVVFLRLKQKEEEWKRAQREWNKVWREVDERNYQKSLDHQGVTFKAADKKAITAKAFVSQIEAAREEQMAKRASLIDPLFARTRPRHQLEFAIDDTSVLQDALKLILAFLDRTQGQINFHERRRVESFLRSFVCLFFNLDPIAFNAAFIGAQDANALGANGAGVNDSDASDDVVSVTGGSAADDVEVASTASGGSRGGRGQRKAGSQANGTGGTGGGDLRKKLLKSEQAKSTSRKTRGTPTASRFASPVVPDEEPKAVATDSAAQARRTMRKGMFFTNTVFYVFLRQLELLYSRLAMYKGLSAQLAREAKQPESPLTNALGLVDVNGNSTTVSPDLHYHLMLSTCERLFDNELEQHAFEDQMRGMFGTKSAYRIFTVDKLIGAIIKQVQTIFVDPKSQDLLENLKRDRALTTATSQDLINSRRNAEKVLGPDENLFRMDWLPDSKTMTVQLIGKDDSSFDDSEILTGRWQAYLDSFVSSQETEGVSQSKVRRPFLRRNIPASEQEKQPEVLARGGLEIKVCTRTYRLFFVPNSEDVLIKIRRKADVEKALKTLPAITKRRQAWLEAYQ